eukprot:CAMPEP_0197440246 /NCGR_PEP_ID=MMETSP1175-20131217/6799_1 /TAXON_ID=1003142 /ORGANISM="Triceratium dubium, Strain CCMP147" /LENGTH=130 /DNA_ID=CAMNT_0042970315 /DNA_START=77 /DNA_END=466 /DNA_ORIENTATION=+
MKYIPLLLLGAIVTCKASPSNYAGGEDDSDNVKRRGTRLSSALFQTIGGYIGLPITFSHQSASIGNNCSQNETNMQTLVKIGAQGAEDIEIRVEGDGIIRVKGYNSGFQFEQTFQVEEEVVELNGLRAEW